MDTVYFLSFKGESVELFRSAETFQSEESLIDSIIETANRKLRHLIEVKTQLIFGRFERKSHESQMWQDNLKTLLAHGFDVVRSSDSQRLEKSYGPLQFKLFYGKQYEYIHFGHFHLRPLENVADQFIKFCKATEYPPGINEHIITHVLANKGGSLIAVDQRGVTILFKRNPQTEIISGEEPVVEFLMKSTGT